MARSSIPNALQMREVKYGGASEADKDAMAERLRAEGRRAEALLLFEGRGGHPFLAEEVRWAVAQGNAFHLLSIRRLGRPVTEAELRACGEAAEAHGRWMDARNLYEDLGDPKALARVAPHLPTALRPDTEAASEEA